MVPIKWSLSDELPFDAAEVAAEIDLTDGRHVRVYGAVVTNEVIVTGASYWNKDTKCGHSVSSLANLLHLTGLTTDRIAKEITEASR